MWYPLPSSQWAAPARVWLQGHAAAAAAAAVGVVAASSVLWRAVRSRRQSSLALVLATWLLGFALALSIVVGARFASTHHERGADMCERGVREVFRAVHEVSTFSVVDGATAVRGAQVSVLVAAHASTHPSLAPLLAATAVLTLAGGDGAGALPRV